MKHSVPLEPTAYMLASAFFSVLFFQYYNLSAPRVTGVLPPYKFLVAVFLYVFKKKLKYFYNS